MSLAQVTLIGNLGRDPEMNYTPDGTAVTKFSLAVTRKSGKDKDGNNKEETTWYNCTAWRNLAEVVNNYASKGRQVFVQGDLVPRSYTTKDGRSGFSLDVIVQTFQLLGKKPDTGRQDEQDAADPLGDLEDHPF